MPMKLRVKSYRGQPPETDLCCLIDATGSLGRASGNDLVLDDPDRYISRKHASIERREAQYYLVDIGSNPSVVNQRLVGQGCETLLQAGDVLMIGDYQIDVDLLPPATPSGDPASVGVTQTLAVFGAPVAPAALPCVEPAIVQPRADVDALAAQSMLHEPVFDHSAMLAEPLGFNLLAGSAQASLFDVSAPARYRGAHSDHLSPELHALQMSVGPAPVIVEAGLIPKDYDPLADLMAPAVAHQQVKPEVATHAEPLSAEGPVFKALLEGLGLPPSYNARSPEALARLVGLMLREATGGTMDMLRERASVKRERSIEMTMIGAIANNPLKFFPDTNSALQQMLATDSPAYLPGRQALQAAFDDLKAHERAVEDGMREALSEVLLHLEPAGIARGVAAPGLLRRLRPSVHKARLWACFTQRYAELTGDGDKNVQGGGAENRASACSSQARQLRARR
ncbi:type VI secretion system-associated FHA domain protein TagH [Pseudomonas sp. NPDC090233]|uniref:type VI secretion system-associated FHA domain protein TagH n=1 Tax=Pseudomonas sp. NPDC090233 TaxID=3364479 RepID=UPI00383B8752